MIAPEQGAPEREAPGQEALEQAELSAESTTSDLSETEPEEEVVELREPTGWLLEPRRLQRVSRAPARYSPSR